MIGLARLTYYCYVYVPGSMYEHCSLPLLLLLVKSRTRYHTASAKKQAKLLLNTEAEPMKTARDLHRLSSMSVCNVCRGRQVGVPSAVVDDLRR